MRDKISSVFYLLMRDHANVHELSAYDKLSIMREVLELNNEILISAYKVWDAGKIQTFERMFFNFQIDEGIGGYHVLRKLSDGFTPVVYNSLDKNIPCIKIVDLGIYKDMKNNTRVKTLFISMVKGDCILSIIDFTYSLKFIIPKISGSLPFFLETVHNQHLILDKGEDCAAFEKVMLRFLDEDVRNKIDLFTLFMKSTMLPVEEEVLRLSSLLKNPLRFVEINKKIYCI